MGATVWQGNFEGIIGMFTFWGIVFWAISKDIDTLIFWDIAFVLKVHFIAAQAVLKYVAVVFIWFPPWTGLSLASVLLMASPSRFSNDASRLLALKYRLEPTE